MTRLLYISEDAALCQDLIIFLDNCKITPSDNDVALKMVRTINYIYIYTHSIYMIFFTMKC